MFGLWRDYWSGAGVRSWLLPAALLCTTLEQTYLLSAVPAWLPWLPLALLAVSLGLCFVLIVRRDPLRSWMGPTRVRDGQANEKASIRSTLAILGLTALLVTPTLWTVSSLRNANAGGHPLSGPTLRGEISALTPSADPILVRYLLAHPDDARYLVATLTTGDATPIIFSTGAPVMAMGGFSGSDPILSVQQLQDAVRSGVVELFWLPSSNLGPDQLRRYFPLAKNFPPTAYSNALSRWISQACVVVPPIESMLHYSPRRVAPRLLFDCPYERKGL
jgi:4-amino-4-deoxy-L-arabinose transferase-like glycosyltransferase